MRQPAPARTRMLLAQRLAAHTPPDLFQENAYELPAFVAANPGMLTPLDTFMMQQNLISRMLPEIVDSVTVNGHVYAMPNDVHRENALFYNKQISLPWAYSRPPAPASS